MTSTPRPTQTSTAAPRRRRTIAELEAEYGARRTDEDAAIARAEVAAG